MPSFPLLRLPLEVQLKVAKCIDDIETFRNFVAIPEVASSLHTVLRVVTNRSKFRLRYFNSLDKRIQRIAFKNFAPYTGSTRDENGVIYIVELRHVAGINMESLKSVLVNRHTFIAITVHPEHGAPIAYHRGQNLADLFLQYLDVFRQVDSCAVGAFGDGDFSLELQDTDTPIQWPKNVTIGGIRYIRVKCPAREIESVGTGLSPINYVGEKGPTLMLFGSIVGSTEENTKALFHRYSKLIGCSESAHVSSSAEVEPVFAPSGRYAFEDITMQNLTQEFSLKECYSFKNIHISGTARPLDDNFDGRFCSYLNLSLVPKKLETGEVPAVTENVIAPGVQRLEINTTKLFPILKNLYFSDSHYMTFRGSYESPFPLEFRHLDEEQILSLSNLVRSTYSLEVDSFTTAMLGKLFPKALDKLKMLIFFDRPSTQGVKGAPLVLEHGKIDLSSLKELMWISEGSHEQSSIDFNKISECFNFTRHFKELTFRTDSTMVNLKSIAAQVPTITKLTVMKGSKLGEPNVEVTPKIVASRPPQVFANLRMLEIKVGHYSNMFGGVSFPALKHLKLQADLNSFEDHLLSGSDMPVLEILEFPESEILLISNRADTSLYLSIYNFAKLKQLLVDINIPSIRLINCPNIEVIDIHDRFLRSISSPTSLTKLKTLTYFSQGAQPLHTFYTGPNVDVTIKHLPTGGPGFGGFGGFQI